VNPKPSDVGGNGKKLTMEESMAWTAPTFEVISLGSEVTTYAYTE
jgi:coenzyme PQQ precursor peptide PqqA